MKHLFKHKIIWNHPIDTFILKWMFRVLGYHILIYIYILIYNCYRFQKQQQQQQQYPSSCFAEHVFCTTLGARWTWIAHDRSLNVCSFCRCHRELSPGCVSFHFHENLHWSFREDSNLGWSSVSDPQWHHAMAFVRTLRLAALCWTGRVASTWFIT